MRKWFISKWDWFLYYRAMKTFERLSYSAPGFTYLFELHLHDLNEGRQIPQSLKSAAERMHQSFTNS